MATLILMALGGYGLMHLVLNMATVHVVVMREVEEGGFPGDPMGVLLSLVAVLYYGLGYSLICTYRGYRLGGKVLTLGDNE